MAQLVNDRVDNPSEAGVERYIGLEHLDPESLKIRRWGSPDDVEAQKLRFQPGDIIFGKRRAYQRKLAVADFEGICSAHAMVLRAREETVVKDFLPFFMQSDTFFDRALSISVGSLSPTINWKTLAREQFTIPPKDEQRQAAEILSAADDVIQRNETLKSSLQQTLTAYIYDFFHNEPLKKSDVWASRRLEDLCDNTITYGIVQAGPHIDDGVPYIRVSDMTKGVLSISGMLRTSKEIAHKYIRSTVEANDIVCALRGQPGLVLKVPEELVGANLTQGTARVSVNDQNDTDYVLWALRAPIVTKQIELEAKGSTFKEITLASLRKLIIPVPILERQMVISRTLNGLLNRLEALDRHLDTVSRLKKGLLHSPLMSSNTA